MQLADRMERSDDFVVLKLGNNTGRADTKVQVDTQQLTLPMSPQQRVHMVVVL